MRLPKGAATATARKCQICCRVSMNGRRPKQHDEPTNAQTQERSTSSLSKPGTREERGGPNESFYRTNHFTRLSPSELDFDVAMSFARQDIALQAPRCASPASPGRVVRRQHLRPFCRTQTSSNYNYQFVQKMVANPDSSNEGHKRRPLDSFQDNTTPDGRIIRRKTINHLCGIQSWSGDP